MNRIITTSLLSVALMGSSGFAAGQGFQQAPAVRPYLGAGVGLSRAKDFCDSADGSPVSCDKEDVAYKGLAGVRIGSLFGLEGGYTNLGEATQSLAGADGNVKVDGYQAQAGVYLPANERVSFFAKGGVFFWNLDANLVAADTSISHRNSNGTDPVGSLGIEGALSDNVRVQLQYDRYFNVGKKENTGESDVDVIGVNAVVLF
ncbi:MAG: outer membrane beta-barrel protein [Marinobacter sp.]|nr:outer membrane beta-barrel protein [Marinobacter sp.]